MGPYRRVSKTLLLFLLTAIHPCPRVARYCIPFPKKYPQTGGCATLMCIKMTVSLTGIQSKSVTLLHNYIITLRHTKM